MLCRCLFPALLAAILFTTSAYAQDDLGQDGLPSRIGGPQCANLTLGRDATLQGSLTVRGSGAVDGLKLELAVTGSGMPVGRKQLKNGGSFSFHCIPKENVMLTVFINGSEFQTVSLGNLMGQPYSNRQDLVVTYSEASAQTAKPGVVTTGELYKRSASNGKLYSEAVIFTQKGDHERAAKLLREIVDSDPADYVAWTQLGNFDYNDARYEEAASEYTSSLAGNPGYLPALIGAGRSNIALKRLDEAAAVLEKAVASDPTSADAQQYLGEAYLQARKGSLAIPHMRSAMELEPIKRASLHLRLASLYNAAGAKDVAVAECKLYLQALPDAPDRANVQKYIDDNSPK